MTTYLTLVPAYGRDYKTADAVLQDWLAGKDFKIADVSNPWDGKPTSIRDHGPDVQLKIRYSRLSNIAFIQDGKLVGKSDVTE